MDTTRNGWVNGFVGMVIFSGTLPATRVAVSSFDPVFVTSARAVIAGTIGLAALLLLWERRPGRDELRSLFIVTLGVVIGFPLLTALALRHISSAHSLVFTGLLPLSTAIFSVLRAGERPRPAFWLFSLLGSAFVVGYAAVPGIAASPVGDLLMLAAIVVCGLGYAEGGRLSRTLGGWQVICWALVLSLPVVLPISALYVPASFDKVGIAAWISLAYVSLFSMLIGFVFWFRGLALAGIAAVGLLQLLQPFFGLGLAAVVLNETVSSTMLAVILGIVACVGFARKFAPGPQSNSAPLMSLPTGVASRGSDQPAVDGRFEGPVG